MEEREKPRNMLDIIWLAYNSSYFDEHYDQALLADRTEFNSKMDKRTKQLKKRNLTLKKKAHKQEYDRNHSNLQPNESQHPERYIKRVFRGADGYLDFRDEIVVSKAKSVNTLINIYKPHMLVHSRHSVAHLCPSKLIFTILTGGVEIQFHGGDDREIRVINTLDQLKELEDRLNRDKTVKVYRHNPQALTRSKSLNLNGLFEELHMLEDIRSQRQR